MTRSGGGNAMPLRFFYFLALGGGETQLSNRNPQLQRVMPTHARNPTFFARIFHCRECIQNVYCKQKLLQTAGQGTLFHP